MPEFEPASSTSAVDIRIRICPIAERAPHTDRSYYRYGALDQYLYWPLVGSFLIRGTSDIDIDPAPEASEALLRLPLLGPVMALLLHMRERLVLHASAVSIGGRVAAFVGDKGAGKSTTTAAAIERGHQLFTDDLLALSFASGRPVATPGFPSVKLVADCAERFVLQGAEKLAAPIADFPKQLRRLNGAFAYAPREVAAIYVLDRQDRAAILELPANDALKAVMRFSYVPLFEGKPWSGEETKRHFSQCASLASHVRVARLITPNRLDGLDEIIRCVEDDLARHAEKRASKPEGVSS
ncbi:MAG: hypothetical protein QM773_01075 [Hyphomonadaceae bacterium]